MVWKEGLAPGGNQAGFVGAARVSKSKAKIAIHTLVKGAQLSEVPLEQTHQISG
jgi:hypothetical protein